MDKSLDGLTEQEKVMITKPSITNINGCCCVCGAYPANNDHHIIKRWNGRLAKNGPTILLCGSGTSGCHKRAEEKKLHFKWEDGAWWYLWLDDVCKYDEALLMGGWHEIKQRFGVEYRERKSWL